MPIGDYHFTADDIARLKKMAEETLARREPMKMDKELADRLQSKLGLRHGRDLFTVEEVVQILEERGLTRRGDIRPSTVSEQDKEHLERIRERDIQRRIAEEGGIIGGMRETFNIAFLLDYIDKLEGRI